MRDLLLSIGYSRWVLDTLLILPVLGGVAVLLAPEARARHVALVASVAELVISLAALGGRTTTRARGAS